MRQDKGIFISGKMSVHICNVCPAAWLVYSLITGI